ncbi:hypothetical protein KC19_12G110300 [Ceratodon purpureus]|uniref:Uncharacterized protein n=1 Tax=Ceratodon purpureus TaxID=3225 RepID=A0A8T0G5X6_CERPU|nr:hypothetical protein KC19_12G110300 [Ceratodon purpureus]
MRLLLYCTSAGHLGITRRSSTTSVLSSGHLSSPNDALQPKLRAPSSEHHLFLTQTQPTHAHHHPEINLHLRDLHSVTSPSSSLLMVRLEWFPASLKSISSGNFWACVGLCFR